RSPRARGSGAWRRPASRARARRERAPGERERRGSLRACAAAGRSRGGAARDDSPASSARQEGECAAGEVAGDGPDRAVLVDHDEAVPPAHAEELLLDLALVADERAEAVAREPEVHPRLPVVERGRLEEVPLDEHVRRDAEVE